jgi:glycerol-3-phosphate acyltransferase PlsY
VTPGALLQVASGLGAAYLLGALPWALWVGRWARGIDVRRVGSGNLGATNVYRTLGPRLGLLVLALDMAKGAVAVLACAALAGAVFPGGRAGAGLAGALAGVLGHVFTIFAGFRGGKGVAAAGGAMIAVAPVASGISLAVFALGVALSRRISVGSILAALSLAVCLWFVPAAWTDRATALVGTLVAALVVLRHLPNIRRLLRGEEPAFHFRRGGSA